MKKEKVKKKGISYFIMLRLNLLKQMIVELVSGLWVKMNA